MSNELLNTLNGKKVRVGIKNGMSLQDFCDKYDCGPCELRTRIDRLFTVKDTANSVWREIQSNERKTRESKTRVKEPSKDVFYENVEERTEEVKEEVRTEPVALELDELKVLERAYSDELIELEKTYKGLFQERLKCRDEYKSLRDELYRLKRLFMQAGRAAEKVIGKDRKIVEKMNEVSKVYHVKREALDKLRHDIDEVSKIVICVYANRKIALFDEVVSEIVLDDTGYEEVFGRLREQEEADEITPKDLRTVARLIKIVANLKVPVEIIFEDDFLSAAYEVFKEIA